MFTFVSRSLTNRKPVIILILILILASLIRILSFNGYMGSDDGDYARLAYEISNDPFFDIYDRSSLYWTRVGLFAPVALCIKIFGLNELAFILYPFLLSMFGIILVFLAGQTFFNDRAGLIAATIMAILPFDTRYASILFPDLPAAFWANLGVLLLYWGLQRETWTLKIIYGVLSGLAIGLAWLTKENIVYLLLFIGLYLVWCSCRHRRNVMVLVGTSIAVITVLVIELLIYSEYTGDFLFRFHAIKNTAQTQWGFNDFAWFTGHIDVGNNWIIILKRIFKDGPRKIFANFNFGLVTGVAVFAIGYALFRKLRSFLFPGIWFLFLVFMFNFGSTSMQSYRPFGLNDRYIYLLLFPAMILVAGLIDELIPLRDAIRQVIDRKKFFCGCTLAVVVMSACLRGIYRNILTGKGCPVERKVSQMIGPGDLIYTDERTAGVLSFFWKYPKNNRVRDFKSMRTNDIPTGVYVLINRNRVMFLDRHYGYEFPKFFNEIPDDWLLRWVGNSGELYWIPKGKS